MIAMDVLYEASQTDALGGTLRICLEAWITGMWVLAEGQDAVDIFLLIMLSLATDSSPGPDWIWNLL